MVQLVRFSKENAFRMLSGCILILVLIGSTACEDDPVAEPASDSQPTGSYGGRLSQPAAGQQSAPAAVFPGHSHNPETY